MITFLRPFRVAGAGQADFTSIYIIYKSKYDFTRLGFATEDLTGRHVEGF